MVTNGHQKLVTEKVPAICFVAPPLSLTWLAHQAKLSNIQTNRVGGAVYRPDQHQHRRRTETTLHALHSPRGER